MILEILMDCAKRGIDDVTAVKLLASHPRTRNYRPSRTWSQELLPRSWGCR